MSESTLQVTGINHVVLHVSDMERSRRFYIDVLGFEDNFPSQSAPRSMSFLRVGSQGLDLFEVGDGAHGGEEMNHMALAIGGDDVDAVCAALRAAGVADMQKTPRSSVMISDPDGHRIELLPKSAAIFQYRSQVGSTA
jgi:glyoxylase I family protein